MAASEVDSGNFEAEVLKSEIPVLLDFWAPWCGPCKAVAPVLDELSVEMEGKVKFAKLNVDEAQEIAARYGVRSIPMLALFRDGEPVDSRVGAQSASALRQWLDSFGAGASA